MIKNKLLAYTRVSIFFGLVPFISHAEDFEVNFNGEMVSTTCQLSSNSLKKDVVLENLRRKTINDEGVSASTPFFIEIDKCSTTDLKKNVKLTWLSKNLTTISGQSYVQTDGESGVLVGLTDQDDNPVIWNTPFTIGAITVAENTQKFNFNVFVRKPEFGEAKVGDFTSIVTFSVEYE